MKQMHNFKLGDKVISERLYDGKEVFTVVGILFDEVEIQGDFSGGTHNVCQRDWCKVCYIQLSYERD